MCIVLTHNTNCQQKVHMYCNNTDFEWQGQNVLWWNSDITNSWVLHEWSCKEMLILMATNRSL